MVDALTATLINKAALLVLTEAAKRAAPEILLVLRHSIARHRSWNVGTHILHLRNVRTLFYSYRNVPIDDFYYHTTLVDPNGRRHFVVDSVDELVPGTSYVISGTAGQGKSIFARHLCLRQARQMADGRLPIFVALGEMDSSGKTLEKALAERFADVGIVDSRVRVKGHAAVESVIEHVFDDGRALLILDGFDEVNSERQGELVRQLEQLKQRHRSLQIIITSRPDTPICHSSAFSLLEMQDLGINDLRPFLQKLTTKSVVESIVEGVQAEAPEVRSVLSTPLMITLLAIVYLSVKKVPPRLVEFYGHVFDVLLYRHDVTKGGGFKRERFSKLGESELSEVFRAICFVARSQQLTSIRRDEWRTIVIQALEIIQDWNAPQKRLAAERRRVRGHTEMSIDPKREIEPLRLEATKNLCILVEEGSNLTFIHKTIAEYLSAEFVQRADEEFAQAYYNSVNKGPSGFFLQPELQFLAELDTKRYVRLFWMPQFRSFCSHNRIVLTKGRDDIGKLEYAIESHHCILRNVFLGFWLEKDGPTSDYLKIEAADQIALPSHHRCFHSTIAELWQEVEAELVKLLRRPHGLFMGDLINAAPKIAKRRDIRTTIDDYELDPTLAWFTADDVLSLCGGEHNYEAIARKFVSGLTLRWQSFRSVQKSENRRRDFLVAIQDNMRKTGANVARSRAR